MIEFVLSGEVGDDGMAFSQGEGVLGVHNGRHFLHGVDLGELFTAILSNGKETSILAILV